MYKYGGDNDYYEQEFVEELKDEVEEGTHQRNMSQNKTISALKAHINPQLSKHDTSKGQLSHDVLKTPAGAGRLTTKGFKKSKIGSKSSTKQFK